MVVRPSKIAVEKNTSSVAVLVAVEARPAADLPRARSLRLHRAMIAIDRALAPDPSPVGPLPKENHSEEKTPAPSRRAVRANPAHAISAATAGQARSRAPEPAFAPIILTHPEAEDAAVIADAIIARADPMASPPSKQKLPSTRIRRVSHF